MARGAGTLAFLLLAQLVFAAHSDIFDDLTLEETDLDLPHSDLPPEGFAGDAREIKNDNVDQGEYPSEENINRKDVFEGDIYLDRSTKAILGMGRDAMSSPARHWLNARVPYVFGSVSSEVRSVFLAAIKEYEAKTCVRFVPRRGERDYIYIVSEGGCFSSIGRSGGLQKLSLGTGCEHRGTAIHEMMHAIGFFHEQSRLDRDSYITIYWDNIKPGMEYNFRKYKRGEADTLGYAYDLKSIMHYPKYAFTKNRQPTIIARNGANIGQRDSFSAIDIQQINALYKCTQIPTQRPTQRPPATKAPTIVCVDKNRNCGMWRHLCTSHSHRDVMKAYCKKTCGLCGPVPSCKDSRSLCAQWARAGYCRYGQRYYPYMKRYCPKSCRMC